MRKAAPFGTPELFIGAPRGEKPGPMPEELWAAADLSKVHSVSKIANTLNLNYTALKGRVHPEQMDHPVVKVHPPAFIELGYRPHPCKFYVSVLYAYSYRPIGLSFFAFHWTGRS